MIDKRKVAYIIITLVAVSAPIAGVISMVIFPVDGNIFMVQLLERIMDGYVITVFVLLLIIACTMGYNRTL